MKNALLIAIAAMLVTALIASFVMKTWPFQPEDEFTLYPPLSALGDDSFEKIYNRVKRKYSIVVSLSVLVGFIVYVVTSLRKDRKEDETSDLL